jgi:hypothetical protein
MECFEPRFSYNILAHLRAISIILEVGSHGFLRICTHSSRVPMASAQRHTIGYLRVSTTAQDVEKYKVALLSLANNRDPGKVYFIEETVSGRGS